MTFVKRRERRILKIFIGITWVFSLNTMGSTRTLQDSPEELNVPTHNHWIQLGTRSFKIYKGEVTYDEAMLECVKHHPDGNLATVTSFDDIQILGRYLLTGKPKISTAWIGAKWRKNRYFFKSERIAVPNVTDGTGYPPWKRNRAEWSGKCILLDRRYSNNLTVFVEANCDRLRSYICYVQNKTGYVDLIRGNNAHRLHYHKKNWTDARDACKTTYSDYSAQLAETKQKSQVVDLYHLMKMARVVVEHMWIGGRFNKKLSRWFWDSDQSEILVKYESFLNWMEQSPYDQFGISNDRCISMDNVEISYGIACKLEHSYVCQFSVDNLKRLQNDEKKLRESLKQNLKDTSEEKTESSTRWLQVGKRSYAIFNDNQSYDNAKQKCSTYHPDAQLAVCPSLKQIKILGGYFAKTYLPFKKVWIGARWIDDHYEFEAETIKLPNTSNVEGYPPWKGKNVKNPGRCIALSQQGLNDFVFIESSCHRKRPYVCYIENNTGFTDFIFPDRGYRFHHNRRNWYDASVYCLNTYGNYSGRFGDVQEATQRDRLLELMMESPRSSGRVWLGGRLDKTESPTKWIWNNKYAGTLLHREINSTANKFFFEDGDICLAMESSGMKHGMPCKFEQSYVCQFLPENLKSLQRDEKNRRKQIKLKL